MWHQRGLTLLELLVAVAIFALLSGLAYRGLVTVVEAQSSLEQAGQQLAELQFAVQLMERDLLQALPRPVRGPNGDAQVALRGRPSQLELTRAGHINALDLPRSELERVSYQLSGSVLQRLSWPVLDRAAGSSPQVQDLLLSVSSFGMRYMDQQGRWHRAWPPPRRATATERWPRAVELQLGTVLGPIRKLIGLVDPPLLPGPQVATDA